MSAPLDAWSELQRAEALIELRRYDEAVTVLSRVIGADHDDPRGWCLLAQAQLGLEDPAAALQSAGRAAALAPDLEWIHRLASLAFSRLGRHTEAVAAAREAVRLAPDSWRGLTRLAQALIPASSDRRQARATAERARDLAPLVPDTHIAVGSAEAASGHRQAAEAAYRKALELDPDNVVAHNELARLHLRTGTPAALAKAATGFATAVRSDPRATVSRHNLDVAVGTFLVRAAGLLLAAALVVRGFGASGTPAARIVPVAVVALPVVFAARFAFRLSRDLRRYLWRTVVHPRSRLIAVVAEAGTVGLIVAGALAPESLRLHVYDVALALAVVSLFSPSGAPGLRRRPPAPVETAPRQDLPPAPTVGVGVLWLMAAAFLAVAVLGVVVAFAPGTASGGVVVALGCAVGLGLTLKTIRRRSRWWRSD